jgi:hypothetical protein
MIIIGNPNHPKVILVLFTLICAFQGFVLENILLAFPLGKTLHALV